jgi:inner membrane protein
MASAFSHVAIPIAIRLGMGKKTIPTSLVIFCSLISAAPDLDVIAFRFGIPYDSPWGHRGFTHSIFFAFFFSFFPILFHRFFKASRISIYFMTFVSMLSHGLLDALTNGGLGVAFLWPFNSQRYFFPWKVVEVSPLSISRFFTEKGVAVLQSELLYIWLPSLVGAFLLYLFSKSRKLWNKQK